jgi:hypothetical protein
LTVETCSACRIRNKHWPLAVLLVTQGASEMELKVELQ